MNKKRIAVVIVMTIFTLIVSFSGSVSVFADSANSGTGHGSGGVATDGTGMFVSNVYGATWRKYAWGTNAPGLTFTSDSTATIDSWDGTGNFHVNGASVVCPPGTPYLWRYSFVAQKNLGKYSAGDLVGVIGIDGNGREFNSKYFGGDMTYHGTNWGQVEHAYKSLYNAGLVRIPWGGGSGLSWFCSNGDDGGTEEPDPACKATSEVTTMTTKIKNMRIDNSWTNITYAMPTDSIKWDSCYGSGVQSNYDKRTDSYVVINYNGAEVFNGGDPEPYHDVEGPNGEVDELTTYLDKRRISDWFAVDRWTNKFALERNFEPLPSSHGDNGGTYDLGKVVARQRIDDYYVNAVGDVGTFKYVTSNTEEPSVYKIWSNWHTWGYKEWTVYINRKDERCGYAYYYAAGTPSPINGEVLTEDFYDYNTCPIPEGRSGANHHDSNYTTTEFKSWPVGETAKVIVPYNFQNSASISVKGINNSDYVFAGDTITVDKAEVSVGTKYNPLTKYDYATIVRGGKVKLLTYVTNSDESGASESDISCGSIDHKNIEGTDYCNAYDLSMESGNIFNSTGNLQGTTMSLTDVRGDYQVYDASAGDYMCFSLAIWPADSGAPDNMEVSGYSSKWAVSTSCKKIAKKPFFGVEGGSMYSSANINTSSLGKTNILGRTDMAYRGKISGAIYKKYFGSFVEQSLFGIKGIKGFASGSSYLGWIGIDNDGFCDNLTPLTMANAGQNVCNGNNGNEAGFMGDEFRKDVDKQAYVDFWVRNVTKTDDTSYSDGFGGATKLYSNTGKNIYYTESDQPLVSSAISIGNSTTRIVKINNTLTINGDIKYRNMGDSILTPGDIPQVLIYANEIKISCNVREIDAILIANTKVDTCYENTQHDPNSPMASVRLDVLGTVITDEILLDRTYGAAIGRFTDDPAELFKYDTSILLWAKYMASAGESNTMTEVYRTEMAPRF